jgi:putative transposase
MLTKCKTNHHGKDILMSEYRRLFVKGAIYFFTVVTYNRQHLLCNEIALKRLKSSFRYAIQKHPFKIKGLVILPDHLHCIWHLPENDHDFSTRWSLFKRYFSSGFDAEINHRREKNIWQRRFWEHLIRNENDLNNCLDYIHYNPVKHGYVSSPGDWPQSTFLHHVQEGYYDLNWGSNHTPKSIENNLYIVE